MLSSKGLVLEAQWQGSVAYCLYYHELIRLISSVVCDGRQAYFYLKME